MKINIVSIDPTLAAEILEGNTDNFRKLNQKWVDLYAKDMAEGEWDLTGDSIKISDSGLVLDGQHRLAAIIKSGVAVTTAVAYGGRATPHQDRGKARTIPQWLAHQGIKSTKNVAAAARLCLLHDAGFWASGQLGTGVISDSDVINYAVNNEEGLVNALNMATRCPNFPIQSTLATILHIGSGRSPDPSQNETVSWFSEGLRTGANLQEGDPPLTLRNKIAQVTGASDSSAKLTNKAIRWFYTLAWNRTVEGKPIRLLRINLTGPTRQQPPDTILVAE